MVSTKPYFVRAIFEWCVDQGLTPYMTVLVGPTTRVPREYVKDGQIVLNIGPEATSQLLLGNEEITFQARFNGTAYPVVVPMNSVSAIFAKENGQGMAFEIAEASAVQSTGDDVVAEEPEDEPPTNPPVRPHLTRVK